MRISDWSSDVCSSDLENVPRIRSRGRKFLDQIIALLRGYGYSVNEDTHDCGVIGGLAQSRKRFLLIARHSAKVPPFVYQPKHPRLRRSEEQQSELQSLMRTSDAVLCLQKKNNKNNATQ